MTDRPFSRRRFISLSSGALLIGSLFACATEPVEYSLPDPDLSLSPAALARFNLIYACGSWVNGPQPSEEKVFVDVSFDRRTAADPDDRPTSRHLVAVANHGGQVVYKFNFPAVRVWIKTSEIPGLSREESVIAVLRVSNLRRYDWPAAVGFIAPYSYQQGASRYAELGGRVDYVFSSINGISGVIPDRSIPELRRDVRVEYVASRAPFADPDCT
jgi:hypothetical protein